MADVIFNKGDRVLCLQSNLIYEAKVLETRLGQAAFYVHYLGWKSSYDEWLPHSKLMAYNAENRRHQKEFNDKVKADLKKRKSPNTSLTKVQTRKNKSLDNKPSIAVPAVPLIRRLSSGTTAVVKKERDHKVTVKRLSSGSVKVAKQEKLITKPSVVKIIVSEAKSKVVAAKKDSTRDQTEIAKPNVVKIIVSEAQASDVASIPTECTATLIHSVERLQPDAASQTTPSTAEPIKIKIPNELKKWLAFDWDAVQRRHRLHRIPAATTVADLLAAYTMQRDRAVIEAGTANPTITVATVCASLVEYFDTLLRTQLLYKPDRLQYAELCVAHPQTAASRLYGAFHLLRLIVRLDELLKHAALPGPQQLEVCRIVHDLLGYLERNSEMYFSKQALLELEV